MGYVASVVTNIFEDLLKMDMEQIAFVHDFYDSKETREAIDAMIALGEG